MPPHPHPVHPRLRGQVRTALQWQSALEKEAYCPVKKKSPFNCSLKSSVPVRCLVVGLLGRRLQVFADRQELGSGWGMLLGDEKVFAYQIIIIVLYPFKLIYLK